MTEIWKAIPGWDGLYEVSNQGRVKSLRRTLPCKESTRSKGSKRTYQERIRKPMTNQCGHKGIRLWRRAESRIEFFFIHRLVLLAFVGPCPEGMECCHNDGNPANNHLDNLRWDTKQANMKDQELHGVLRRGGKNGMAKLTEAQVRKIRDEYAAGKSPSTIARKYGMASIHGIVTRKTWKHVT